jgi:DNA alkylation repair enzyme
MVVFASDLQPWRSVLRLGAVRAARNRKLAEFLLDDNHDSIQKATGGLLRQAGKKDCQQLLGFLDRHAATMARTTLSYAIEHLDKEQRDRFRRVKRQTLDRT